LSNEALDPRETDSQNCNGYAPFPETIIVSMERSGLNLIRHIIESLTNYRTPGKTHIHTQGALIFHRTHRVTPPKINAARAFVFQNEVSNYCKMILLLRDPREIFVRTCEKDINMMKHYFEMLDAFERFSGKKQIIYYDDLIANDDTFSKIFTMLGIEKFYDTKAIPELRKSSVNWYDSNQQMGGGSQTKGDTTLLKEHQKKLTKEELDELQRLIAQQAQTTVRHLDRWRESSV